MVVQHNLTAMNSNRMLGLTTKAQAKSTEKLSSGYKINRAADDAAGLAISEKMRKQVRGLTQASANAQDGISTVQTAEGALTEVHDMLQRMNELAVKSANGTNSENDRSYIQSEVDALIEEIDRVSTTTKFNETYLLKGDEAADQKDVYSYVSVNTPSSATIKAGVDLYAADGTQIADEDALKAALDADKNAKFFTTAPTTTGGTEATAGVDYAFTAASVQQNGADFDLATNDVYEAGSDTKITDVNDLIAAIKAGTELHSDSATNGQVNATKYGGALGALAVVDASATITNDVFSADGTKYTTATLATALAADATTKVYTTAPTLVNGTAAVAGTDYTYTPASEGKAQLYDKDGKAVSASDIAKMVENGDKLYEDKNAATEVADLTKFTEKDTVNGDLVLSLHVGADSTDDNKIEVTVASMSAAGIGVNDLDVSTKDAATAAIDTISEAIKQVSKQRSDLGAIQNRLEHTINNLDNVVENTTSAESQIRDTDMATEMVKYANNNILAQAGQAMLAQANQANQGVLSLLG